MDHGKIASKMSEFSYDLIKAVLDWVVANLYPDEVFVADELEKWAENNDYHQEDLGPDRIDE